MDSLVLSMLRRAQAYYYGARVAVSHLDHVLDLFRRSINLIAF